MDGRWKKFVLMTLCSAVFCGCQRDEPQAMAESPPGAARQEAPVAWIDGDRIVNADGEPQNWLAHGRTPARAANPDFTAG